jgi:hypothetical protein
MGYNRAKSWVSAAVAQRKQSVCQMENGDTAMP